jgi:hypothetical protein
VGEGFGVALGKGSTALRGLGGSADPMPGVPVVELPELPAPEPVEGWAGESGRVAVLPSVDGAAGEPEDSSSAALSSFTEPDGPAAGTDEAAPGDGKGPGPEVQPASNRLKTRQAAGIAVVLSGLRPARMTAPRSCPSTCSSTVSRCDLRQNAATVTVRTRVDHAAPQYAALTRRPPPRAANSQARSGGRNSEN